MSQSNFPRRRHYADWLKAFIEYASHGEAPLSMYFWVGVSTIAGALRRRVWIDQAYFTWIPNFYVILVGPPAVVAKSTTAGIGMDLLRNVPGIKFGPDAVTWQALAKAFAQSIELVEMPDGRKYGMSEIMIELSELGTFLDPEDGNMIDFLVALWDGKRGAVRKLTKTQGEDIIESPCINIIACTTPAWIEGNVPEYVISGGFTSRCVFIYADRKRQLVAYPALHIPKDFYERREKLIEDLCRIGELRGEYRLLPSAIEWGERWYEAHYKSIPPHLNNERFAGYLNRKQTHMHKLAMVLSAATRDTLEITAEDLEKADKILTSLEHDMPRVFEGIGTSIQARAAVRLVSVVQAHGKLTTQELYSALFRELSYNDFQTALEGAIKAGRIRLFQENNKLYVAT